MAGVSGESIFEVESNIDGAEDDGLIIIAEDKIPDNWPGAVLDIHSYHSLDRNFVFAGEQVRLLVRLSTNKHKSGNIATPENVVVQGSSRQNKNFVGGINPVSHAKYANTDEQNNQKDASTGESIFEIDGQRKHTDQILERFKNSYFFARIAESNEPLWSERSAQEACFKLMETSKEKLTKDSSETAPVLNNKSPTSVMIDKGELHSPTSGGVARGAAKCFSLSNGDIVVILQIKVGIEFMRDPILEILQLEKYHERTPSSKTQKVQASSNDDPYGELLNWLLPVNNPRRSSAQTLSPEPSSSSRTSIHSTTPKRASSVSSGMELFSFGHVRSYSMSAIPPNKGLPETVTKTSARPSSVQEDKYQFSFRSFIDVGNSGNEKLLSFRGVSLVPERFSIQCGLEGLFSPGRSWRRKFDLIQPLEIHSFSVDCNTEDLICVHIKNVSPAHVPDVVVFIDSITMVFEVASSSGPPLSLPVTCTESGNDYSLPNLALRRDEEHSFILKPVTTLWRNPKAQMDINFGKRRASTRPIRSSRHPSSNTELKYSDSSAVQYAVLVSCSCNYTKSKLFFRHPVSWRPRIARDLVISVASDASRQTVSFHATHLPVQSLTLQASNMTSDDLTLTVMTPSPLTSTSSPVSLHTLPFSPLSPFGDVLSSASPNQVRTIVDGPQSNFNVIPRNYPSCTHLCLQTRVPLGCVPSKSAVAINLELLSMTNGIVTLDSLQIDVKEKGVYKPKNALKIAAKSSNAPVIS